MEDIALWEEVFEIFEGSICSTDPTGLYVDYGNGGRKEVDDKTGDVLCDISSDGTDNLAGEPEQGPTEPVIPEVDTASVIKSLLLGVRDGFTAPFTSEYWQNVGNFLQHPIKTSVAGFNATLFVLTQGSLEDQARMFRSMIPGIAFGQNLAIASTFGSKTSVTLTNNAGSKAIVNGVEDSATLRQQIAEGARWRGNELNKHAWDRHPGLAKNGVNQLPNSALYDQRARQNILNANTVIPRAKGDYLFLDSSNGWASIVQPDANGGWFFNSFRLQTLNP